MWGRATSARRCLLFAAAAEQEALWVFRQIRHRLFDIPHRFVDMNYGAMRVAANDFDLLGRSLRHFFDARGDFVGTLV